MGEVGAHIFIITVAVTFLWVGFIGAVIWGYKKLFWDPMIRRRAANAERARRMADRKGSGGF